jgi:hypothetical protein
MHPEGKRMSQDAAKIVMDVVIRNAAEQNAAPIKIQPLCTAEEFREYRHMIGRSMGAIICDVINPIVAKYPALKPPQLM